MAPWLIPLGLSLLGGFLKHKGKKNQEEEARRNEEAAQRQAYEAGNADWQKNAARSAFRGQFTNQLLSKWFPGMEASGDVSGAMGTMAQRPPFSYVPGGVKSSTTGDIGSFLSSIAPFTGGMGGGKAAGLGPLASSLSPSETSAMTGGGTTPPRSQAFIEYLRKYYPEMLQGEGSSQAVPIKSLSSGM